MRFYFDVLALGHLHYGLWQAGEETSLANLKAVQARYQQAIIDLLPPPTARIHVVGFGRVVISGDSQTTRSGNPKRWQGKIKTGNLDRAKRLGKPLAHLVYDTVGEPIFLFRLTAPSYL